MVIFKRIKTHIQPLFSFERAAIGNISEDIIIVFYGICESKKFIPQCFLMVLVERNPFIENETKTSLKPMKCKRLLLLS